MPRLRQTQPHRSFSASPQQPSPPSPKQPAMPQPHRAMHRKPLHPQAALHHTNTSRAAPAQHSPDHARKTSSTHPNPGPRPWPNHRGMEHFSPRKTKNTRQDHDTYCYNSLAPTTTLHKTLPHPNASCLTLPSASPLRRGTENA